MKLNKILLVLTLCSIASAKNLRAQTLPEAKQIIEAQKEVIDSQDAEIKTKNVLISTLESTQKTMAARYLAREQELSTQAEGWKKRFEIAEEDSKRNRKARDQNKKLIAPGLGGAFAIGVLVGLLAH